MRFSADPATLSDKDLSLDNSARAYFRTFLDHCKSADMNAFCKLNRRIDDGGGMDARGAHRLRRRENLRRGHARKIGVFHADDGTWRIALPVFRQKNC